MSTVLSECGTYRYRLERECGLPVDGSITFAYFGINPSTADWTIDDATVRKWRGFTARNNGHRFLVGNLFAYRSTDPKALSSVADPFGPDWGAHMRSITSEADILVPCWGRLDKVPKALQHVPDLVLQRLLSSGKPVMHFGKTGCGQPKHPLMLGYDTKLISWEGRV